MTTTRTITRTAVAAVMMTLMATMMMTIKTTMGNAALTVITTATGADTAQISAETMTATALSVMGAPVVAIPAVRAAAARMTGTADISKRTEKDAGGSNTALAGITTTAHGVMVALVVTVGAAKATVETTGKVAVAECGERRIVEVAVGVGVEEVMDSDVEISRR